MAYRKLYTNDDFQNKLQDEVQKTFLELEGKAIIINRVMSVNLFSGNTIIYHNLTYTPTQWLILDKSAAADIYRVSSDALTIVLNSSAAVTVRLAIL